MEKEQEILLKKVKTFVKELFEKELPKNMYFHSFEHTLLVVEGVKIICKQNSVSENELLMLTLAAFLHDVGYTKQYIGHELASVKIAYEFLLENGLERDQIEVVSNCILATKYPQLPDTDLEKIICDADFYHFSLQSYTDFATRLKREWEENLSLVYTDREWDAINIKMLTGHEYFTTFGKQILQKKKNLNIEKLIQRFT
ncbi:HD domain-containing protein [Pedobacter sp. ISL-68]|uniref:HD domain-containing protein n=1 Tax=unclassified Pedobacter TaxID=2628915 RepID=UPI001BEB6D09|nr:MULTISPECIES: HD domain-containing protein [unclassified Pedobacter]MBT2560829.1 HD domain-containing protein [Pedobacter sp. ISL-64]MBT2590208.1 HD domain-containing protein [Pedobacter sp. ISL-68]